MTLLSNAVYSGGNDPLFKCATSEGAVVMASRKKRRSSVHFIPFCFVKIVTTDVMVKTQRKGIISGLHKLKIKGKMPFLSSPLLKKSGFLFQSNVFKEGVFIKIVFKAPEKEKGRPAKTDNFKLCGRFITF